MTNNDWLSFEIYIMDLCEHAGCKTAKDYEELSQQLHESIETAIMDMNPAHVRPIIDGNWIPVTNGRGGHECSRCHQYAPSYQAGNEYLSRFCPFCGCYMGEE